MESDIDKTLLFEEIKLADLKETSKAIYDFGKEYKIWLFHAEMGAGKTTLIKSICNYLQVSDHVSSPTFALVNEYLSIKAGVVYHFDFYRIKKEMEAFEIGAEEYFYSGNLCLIEWPEMVPSLLPDSFLKIDIINVGKADSRVIKVKKHGKGDVS